MRPIPRLYCSGIVHRLSFFIQRDLSGCTAIRWISAIHIAGKAAAQYGVIQTGIEFNTIGIGATANGDAAEVFIPFLADFCR